jgi:hypothetical protein
LKKRENNKTGKAVGKGYESENSLFLNLIGFVRQLYLVKAVDDTFLTSIFEHLLELNTDDQAGVNIFMIRAFFIIADQVGLVKLIEFD